MLGTNKQIRNPNLVSRLADYFPQLKLGTTAQPPTKKPQNGALLFMTN
jgi:hypothetical protein